MITVNFAKQCGKTKPLHAVNNGPDYKLGANEKYSNINLFKNAGIPYVRNHDASYYQNYGCEHTVDVHAIFPDFSKDPYDEKSYDFPITDEYIKAIVYGGSKVFYRLGSKIEHTVKKYGTLPPLDFNKWAVICEHIIRHYNEGWADGFEFNIEYWEIWNEPDLDPDDSVDKRTWGGTAKQFYDLYRITATHLKSCFPHLKIGGPSLCSVYNTEWLEGFFNEIGDAPLDFFSWHRYADNPHIIEQLIYEARKTLDAHGYKNTESILNEWNYVKEWSGEDFYSSMKTIKSLKGSSFISAILCLAHNSPLDMLMYYDARPCRWNGLFNTDFVYEPLKGYYPIWMYNKLYILDYSVYSQSNDDTVYVAAAADKSGNGAVMLSYFDDEEKSQTKTVDISFEGFGTCTEGIIEFYCLDETCDAQLVKTEELKTSMPNIRLDMSLFSTYLILVKPI